MIQRENSARVRERVGEIYDIALKLDRGPEQLRRAPLERPGGVNDHITLPQHGSERRVVLDIDAQFAVAVRRHDRCDPDVRQAAPDHAAEEARADHQDAPQRSFTAR